MIIKNQKSDRNKSPRHHHFTWHSRHWYRLLCLLYWRPYQSLLLIYGAFQRTYPRSFSTRSTQSADGISSLVNRACSLASLYAVASTWRRRALGVVLPQLLYRRLYRQRHRQLFFNYEHNGVTPFLRMIFPYLAVVPVITHEKAFSARS